MEKIDFKDHELYHYEIKGEEYSYFICVKCNIIFFKSYINFIASYAVNKYENLLDIENLSCDEIIIKKLLE